MPDELIIKPFTADFSDCFQFMHRPCLGKPARGEVVGFFRPEDNAFGFRCKSCSAFWFFGKGQFREMDWKLFDPTGRLNSNIILPGKVA